MEDEQAAFLDSKALEKLTGIKSSTWRYWAGIGEGPHSFRLGRRRVWRRSTVEKWLAEFRDAWQTDRPTEGSALYAVLEPVARAADDWDFEQPAEAQVDKFMGVVAEAGRRLAEDDLSEATAEEVVADLENLLKVSVLVARGGHWAR